MPQISANLALARKAFREHGGMLRTSNALRLGIHPRSLYALRDSGEVIPVGRGLYRLANAPALTNPDWIKVGLRIPRAVICLSPLSHTMSLQHRCRTTSILRFRVTPKYQRWTACPLESSGFHLAPLKPELKRLPSIGCRSKSTRPKKRSLTASSTATKSELMSLLRRCEPIVSESENSP